MLSPLSCSRIRRSFRCGVLAIVAVSLLGAVDRAVASELRVSWNRCGDAGVPNKAFACNTDVGTDTLVVSVLTTFDFQKLVHVDITMFVCFSQFVMVPDWWRVLGTGGCRSGALSATAVSPGGGCTPIWDPVGGSTQRITEYRDNVVNGFRFLVSVSVGDSSQARDIAAGQEFEIARLAIDHTRTAGTGACAGCSTAADIGAQFVYLYAADGRSVEFGSGSTVTWQDPNMACTAVTPVRNQTWGSIKSLYR